MSRLSTWRMPVAASIQPLRVGPRELKLLTDVGASDRVAVVHRADGDDRRIIARRADGAVVLLTCRVLAEIAGRDDHRDAGGRCTAHRGAQRVGLPALGAGGRQAEVEHADVVFLGVVDHPLDAFDRIADGAVADAVENAHVVDLGVRRHAGGVARRSDGRRPACGHRRDMRAVAVGVLVAPGVGGDPALIAAQRGASRLQRDRTVDAHRPVGLRLAEHLHVACDAGAAAAVVEELVVAHHAGVQHRDADAGAVQAAVAGLGAVEAHVGGQRAGDRFECAGGALGRAVRRHAKDVGARRERRHEGRGHRRAEHLQPREAHVHATAGRLDGVTDGQQLGIGRVAGDEHLDVANAVDVLRPLVRGRRRRIEGGLQVLGDLLRFEERILGVRVAGAGEQAQHHGRGEPQPSARRARQAALDEDGESGG